MLAARQLDAEIWLMIQKLFTVLQIQDLAQVQ